MSILAICMGLLAMTALAHFLPQFTRPDVFFGVTVDPAFPTTGAARRLLRDYRIALWCIAVVAAVLTSVLQRPAAAVLIDLIGLCGAQVVSHRRALIHAATPSTMVEVDLSAPKEHFPGGLLAALPPFLVLLALGAWALPHLDRLPGRLPVHWGLYGPNRWVITSSRAIIGLLMLHAFVCLLLTVSALGVLHWSRRVRASGPSAAAERQFRRRTLLLVLSVEYFTILPPVFDLLQAPALAMKLWTVALLLTLLAFLVSLMRAGQGGTRLAVVGGGTVGDRTADARWIGGLIYFDRRDPAILVEKRMGIGWTLNFGNLWSWVALAGIAVIVAIGPVLLRADDRGEPLKDRPASSGTEESLRRYIVSLQRGHPNYEEMSPKLAASVTQQLPKIMNVIAGLGDFQSLAYEGADSEGSDVYVAAFARGRLEWHIAPLVEGRVIYRRFRPLPN